MLLRHRVFIYGSLLPTINTSIHQRFMGKCQLVGPAHYQGGYDRACLFPCECVCVSSWPRFDQKTLWSVVELTGRMYIVDKRTEEEKQLGWKETTDVILPSEVQKYPAVIPSEDPAERVRIHGRCFVRWSPTRGSDHTVNACVQVLGMVFDIPDEHTEEVLRALDEYEDCVDIPEGLAEYRRDRVVVRLAVDGQEAVDVETWMYLWVQEVHGLVRVENGDYRSVYAVMRNDCSDLPPL